MVNVVIPQELRSRGSLPMSDLGQFRIGALVVANGLTHGTAVPNDVEIHGREGTGGSDRTHAETGLRRNEDVAVDDRQGAGDVVDEQR